MGRITEGESKGWTDRERKDNGEVWGVERGEVEERLMLRPRGSLAAVCGAALQSGCVNSFRLNGGRNPHKGRCTNIVGNPSAL